MKTIEDETDHDPEASRRIPGLRAVLRRDLEEVYRLAIERIEALAGCTEHSCEERELIDWATIANTYKESTACARGETQAVVP
jgi:hypothetical protein